MLLLLSALALAGDPLTLDQALGLALRDNLEISGLRRENAIADLGLAEARAAFDPQLTGRFNTGGSSTPTNDVVDGSDVVTSSTSSWSAGLGSALPTGGFASVNLSESLLESDSANAAASRFTTNNLGVSVSQPLLRGAFQGGLASLRDAQLAVAEQELRWRQQIEELTLNVTDAYWGLVSARQGRALADRSVELADRQLSETVERQEAGFAGSGDVLQVRVALGQAQRGQVDAVASQQAAEARLARVLGMPVEAGSDIEPVDLPEVATTMPDRAETLVLAHTHNAGYRLMEIQYERSMRAVRRARNGALPDLSVDGSAGWSAGADTVEASRSALITSPAPSWGVGASVSLPLIMRDSVAAYQTAKLREEQAELTLQAAEQDLILEVDEALRTVTRDQAALTVAQQTLEHAQLSLEAQRELLGEGRGSTRDVVDALESLRQAEASKLQAEIGLQASVMRLRRVAGTLLEE